MLLTHSAFVFVYFCWGEGRGGVLTLECRRCRRSFGNKRQILKHICLREEDDNENGEKKGGRQVIYIQSFSDEPMWLFSESVGGGEEEGGSENVDSGGVTVNHVKQKHARFSKEKSKFKIWLQSF